MIWPFARAPRPSVHPRRRTTAKHPSRKRARPSVEPLEMRLAPAVLFNDFFDNGAFSSLNWSQNQSVTLDVFKRLNPPSPAYAARFDGSIAGGELLASTAIDLGNETGVTLSYYYQRAGGGMTPAAGDDLVLEHRKPDARRREI